MLEQYAREYAVSTVGRVYSFKSKKLMSTYRDPHNYPMLRVCHRGVPRLVKVAELVLEAFVGPRPPGLVVRHLNDISDDSRLENLKWGTMSENRYDSVRNGVHFHANVTHCLRGHALLDPNLRASSKREGRRGCLVCSKEQHRARYAGEEPDYSRADERYRELMGSEPSRAPRVYLADRSVA